MALAREERRFGGVSPGVAFALATAGERVGDERRRRGLRRAYGLAAVGPGAEDGRGGVDHVEDGTGRAGRRLRQPSPVVWPSLEASVARGGDTEPVEKKAAKFP